MGNRYSYNNRRQIVFTDDDITLALDGLTKDERHKVVATLTTSPVVSSDAVKHFAALAFALHGQVKSDYGLSIVVPKTDEELREAALYNLRYTEKHEVLRDLRAAEQGVEPEPEESNEG